MIDWLAKMDIATAVMLGVMLLGAWVLWKVQRDKNNNFDFEEMLRDDFGKPSAFRLAIFISLAVSTWVIMYIVLKTNAIDSWVFVSYLAIWSGAKVADSAINAYGASKQSDYGGSSYRRRDIERYSSRDANNEDVSDRRPRHPPPNGSNN